MNQISEEVAAEQIEAFKKYYEIDIDDLTDNLKPVMVSSFQKLKRAIMSGRLEIEITEETILVKQHLKREVEGLPNPIVYKEVSGRAKMGIKDDSTDYGKMYGFLGALCGEGPALIQKLTGPDISLAESLGVVFLQI